MAATQHISLCFHFEARVSSNGHGVVLPVGHCHLRGNRLTAGVDGMGRSKKWTAVGAARSAREARIETAAFLTNAPIARTWFAGRMMQVHDLVVAQTRGDEDRAKILFLGGLGLAPPYSSDWNEVADMVIDGEAELLAKAQLYVLSPAMCDVVLAASEALTTEDLALISEDDLPSPAGVVVLPHPVLVRSIDGYLRDDRAYTWSTPARVVRETTDGSLEELSAVQISNYDSARGPLQPASIIRIAAEAAAQGTPLPPWTLDGIRSEPFRYVLTAAERQVADDHNKQMRQYAANARAGQAKGGVDERGVIGEYAPGQQVADHDGRFAQRFLYAFWRLCEQRIAEVEPADVTHSAATRARTAGVSADVRVVSLRSAASVGGRAAAGRDWQHRWVVRMHEVRQWYPTQERHRVLYRGPYVKGPADKPILGGEVVRAVVR
ncbi:hypothetical protein [Pseudonocardia sp. GCM10023141]|uniref:hypothetical protein n=1 Tax=Pseudonocardia sp. GCM10023141 TaxID=3252653 RepID=UPI0036129447